MDTRSGLLRYGFVTLAWLAGVEWLLGRAVSRIAASPALDGPPRTVIEFLGGVGLFLLAPVTLLAVSLLLLSASTSGAVALSKRDKPRLALAIYIGLFAVVSVSVVFVPRSSWLSITFALLALLAFWWIAFLYARIEVVPSKMERHHHSLRVGVLLAASAYTGYLLYLLLQELETVGPASPVSPIVIRDLGEVFLVAAPFAFFAALAVPFRQWLKPTRWVLPLFLALALAIANITDMVANQGFTGVFAIWSIGLSYYLPWPLYAISLALYIYAILTCLSSDQNKSELANKDRAIGLLLLTFASYELQFPYQYVLALLSFLLLSGLIVPFRVSLQPVPWGPDAYEEGTLEPRGEMVPQSQPTPPTVTT